MFLLSLVPLVDAPKHQREKQAKAPPKCTMCKQPMKGHKFVKECPKNARASSQVTFLYKDGLGEIVNESEHRI